MMTDVAERFENLRPLLIRHAYRMLGDYGEAEDVAQDAYLRFSDAVAQREVGDDRAFLRTIVTRLSLDRLRAARAKREVYVGPWLPEPVMSEVKEDPEASAILADDISFALLLALDRLAPLERAAFLLHDALGVPFDEVAQTLQRSEPSVRKLASRAREHVRDANRHSAISREEAIKLRESLLSALAKGSASELQMLLTKDVVLVGDGGGKVQATLTPVLGRDRVTEFLLEIQRQNPIGLHRIEVVTLNGAPGFVFFGDDGLETAMALEVSDGKIAAMYAVRNPEKLHNLQSAIAGQSTA